MLHRRRPAATALALALLLLLATCSEPTGPDQRLTPNFDVTAPVVLFGAGDISGCTSTGDEQTATLLDGLLAANPASKVFADGDVVYDNATAADFQNCYDPTWGRFKAKTVPVAGNHEYYTGTATAYFDYFNGVGVDSGAAGNRAKGYYSYNTGAWHVVVLNANSSYVGTKAGTIQETWLRNDLTATAQPCILALWHQPRFRSGDTLPVSATLDFWKDLYAAGADLIINGHQHFYERFAPQTPLGVADPANGIRQIIVGTGGKSVSTPSPRIANSEVLNGGTFGVIKLTLGDGTYSWQFMPVAGKSFTDSGSGTCHGSAPPPPSNTPPTASFSNSCTNLGCNFTDTSTDPDGTIASRSWTFGDGGTSTATNPSHTYAAAGTYTVGLTVTDNQGATGSTSRQVTVSAANVAPTAAFTSSCTNLACSFTDKSTDSDGSIASWSWTFGDGGTSTTGSPSHNYAAAGTYTVGLTVTDNKGAQGSTSTQLTVTAANNPPTAAFSASCVGLTCNFTDGSTDTDGTVVGWSWNFGDGGSSTVRNPSHGYAARGTYTVTLTARDDKGATASTSKQVTANAIALTAKGRKVKGYEFVDLTWSGAASATVDVYRNGSVVLPGTANDGAQTDALNRKGAGTFNYKICEAGSTTVCSNQATVVF